MQTRIINGEKHVVVTWPESQEYMSKIPTLIPKYDKCAYLVPLSKYNGFIPSEKLLRSSIRLSLTLYVAAIILILSVAASSTNPDCVSSWQDITWLIISWHVALVSAVVSAFEIGKDTKKIKELRG